jgi:hypothetical protein
MESTLQHQLRHRPRLQLLFWGPLHIGDSRTRRNTTRSMALSRPLILVHYKLRCLQTYMALDFTILATLTALVRRTSRKRRHQTIQDPTESLSQLELNQLPAL